MSNKLSINRVKTKSSTSVRGLYNEYTRDEKNAIKYDDGHRNIDVNKTKYNVLLFDVTDGHIEKYRHDRIREVNEKRKNRKDLFTIDDAPEDKKTDEEKAKWLKRSNQNRTQKIRTNTVDVVTNVVQLGNVALKDLDEEQQELAYRAAFKVMQSQPKKYGEPIVASIHKDETSMHLQVMTSAVDMNTMTCRAKEMFGNKSAMSNFQTTFVDEVNNQLEKDGYDFNLERGLKRIDNPDYKNFKDELTSAGYEVNRYNDNALLDLYKQKKSLEHELQDAKTTQSSIAMDMFDAVQHVEKTGFEYRRDNYGDALSNQPFKPAHFLEYKGHAKPDSKTYQDNEATAINDVKEFNEACSQPHALQQVGLWMKNKMDYYAKKSEDKYRKIKSGIGNAYFGVVTALNPYYKKEEYAPGVKHQINNELEGIKRPGALANKATKTFIDGKGRFTKEQMAVHDKLLLEKHDKDKEFEETKRKHDEEQRMQQRNNFGPDA